MKKIASYDTDGIELQGGAITIEELATFQGHHRIFAWGYDDEQKSDFLTYVSGGDADVTEKLKNTDLKARANDAGFQGDFVTAPRVYVAKEHMQKGLNANLASYYMDNFEKEKPGLHAV